MAKATYYEVYCEYAANGSTEAFTTKREAMKARSTMQAPNGRVVKVVTADLPLRELVVRLASGTGYAQTVEEVAPPMPEVSDD